MKISGILNNLSECRVRFQWLGSSFCGKYIPHERADDEILINLELETVDTAIHEVLHREHSLWSEKKVIKKTFKILQNLTAEQIHKIFAAVVERHNEVIQAEAKERKRKGRR